MKVILTGATGLVGGAVLKRLLSHSAISAVVVLSRRELSVKDPKLQVAIRSDFHNYDAALLEQLKGAEACIWALGTPTGGREVHLGFTMAAASAFASSLVKHLPEGVEKFQFVLTSGAAVERDAEKQLWFLNENRKMRGELETRVVELQQQNAESWESFVVRPAMITKGQALYRHLMLGFYITDEELAAAMVDIVVAGSEIQTLDNAQLRARGKAALMK